MGLPLLIFGFPERLLNSIQIGASSLLRSVQASQDESHLFPRVLAVWRGSRGLQMQILEMSTHCQILGRGSGLVEFHYFHPPAIIDVHISAGAGGGSSAHSGGADASQSHLLCPPHFENN